MKIDQVIAAFKSNEQLVRWRYLNAGLSNHNFDITTDAGRYLLKHYKQAVPDSQLVIQQQLHVAKLAPQVIAVSHERKLALFEYRQGCIATQYNKLSLVKQLVKLHQLRLDHSAIDLAALFRCYQGLPQYQSMAGLISENLTKVASFPVNLGCCHNDLVVENILKTTTGYQLIDFEYVQNNDVFFDLAAVVSSYKLTQHQQRGLLKSYINIAKLSISINVAENKLKVYCVIYEVLCYLWYLQQGYEQKAQQTLKRINL